jgi:uracil-DNA glycosylase
VVHRGDALGYIDGDRFVGLLTDAAGGPLLFNQYRDDDPELDVPGASALRRRNLAAYLDCFRGPPEVMLCGEAPGPRGARFSGIAFTSEHQLVKGEVPFRGVRTSSPVVFKLPREEISGRVVWAETRRFFPRVFLWNAIPFHPFQERAPLSVRNPSAKELGSHEGLLGEVLGLVRPRRVVAVGRSAQRSLVRLGVDCDVVRHPSFGGIQEFRRQVRRVLGAPAAHESLIDWVAAAE